MLQGEHHLGQRTRTRGGFHVPEVGLGRAEQRRRADDAPATHHAAQRVGLDGVTENGAGTVRLHVIHLTRIGGRVDIRRPQNLHLRFGIGREDAVGPAVGVDRGTGDHREDVVAVAASVGEPLEDEHATALGADHAVGVGGERLDVPVLGDGADGVEPDRRGGGQDHVDAAGQRHVGFART